jgi:heme-degrading monooxygenase HmoA
VTLAPSVRLFGFQPTRPAFDNVIRDWMAPAIRSQPGVIAVYAGRHGPDELGPRLIVSVWHSAEAMAAAFGTAARHPGLDAEGLDGIAARTVEVFRAEIAVRDDSATDRPRIIRTLRGVTQPGRLGEYIGEVRNGLAQDIAAGHGPAAFYLTRAAATDTFTALSIWTAWEAIEQATGGDIRRPTATRHPELIASWEARHYEAIDL